MKSTFIKLDRNILSWRWYKDGNTFRVFLHFLLTANVKPAAFRDVFIDRGELLTSYDSVANTLKLSKQEVRTAFRHLIATGEITVTRCSKFSIVSVVNYETYQSKQHKVQHDDQHSANTHPTVGEHHIKNIKNERTKEIYKGLGVTDEKVLVALAEYEEMREQKKKPLTDNGRKRLLEKLNSITANTNKQVMLLETATDNHWLSVFDNNPSPQKKGSNAEKYQEFVDRLIKQQGDGE